MVVFEPDWQDGVHAGDCLIQHLFQFSPDANAIWFNLDVYDVRATTDRAVFDIFLVRSLRNVDGNDNLFTT
jgi:hypothetical protein